MDDPTHMVTFARVVEAKGFAEGARRLGLSTSVASKHVAKLEQSLGARLLNRSTRKLSLTEAGQAFYAHCVRLVEELEAAEQSIANLGVDPQGLLRVSAPPSITALHIAPALTEFRRRYPRLDLEFDLSGRVVDFSEEGYDLALRIGTSPGAGLNGRPLAPLKIGVVAAPTYLQQRGTPQQPEELSSHECLLLSLEADPTRWTLESMARRVAVDVQGALRCNVMEPLHQMALHGLGVARLPSFMTGQDVREGRLVHLLRGWRQAHDARLWAVWPARRDTLPKVRLFVDFLAAQFGEEPYWDRAQREGPRS